MKILIAKTAGFCMGVRRAVEMAMDTSGDHQGPIYTFGPLIHNAQVLDLLRDKGVSILTEIPDRGTGTVLIRAHGVPPKTKLQLKKAGFSVIDATCPRVIKVQSIISRHAKKGYASVIIGDKDHPEVTGLLGYAGRNGHVVRSLEELESLPTFDQAVIVAQTTQNTRFFSTVKQWAREKHPEYKIFDTICDSTERRQAEVKRLAAEADIVIVVGAHNSGNTQRLAEIAGASGKPSYHIETEADLDSAAAKGFSSVRRVGITAGASTPNWIIKRVYRAVESLQFNKDKGWRRALFMIQRTLMLTNIYVSIGAGALCYAFSVLQGTRHFYPYIVIAVLFVQSMHILNHLTGRLSDQYNDPERALFYVKHKVFLTALANISGAAGLMLAFTTGWFPFLLLFTMSALGLSYNLRIIPAGIGGKRYRRIRDIPGSKTILIALAWGIVTAVFPSFAEPMWDNSTVTASFLISSSVVFTRTAFFDILDMQGDRIVGRETIPILLGENSSLRLLKKMLVMIAIGLLLATGFGIVTGFGLWLLISPILMYFVLWAFERRKVQPGIRLEFLVESNIVLTGCLALLWSIMH
ncbi:MAG: 4-hydroxy-3-methylbut-2-enyl diphosphate reductase [Desulfobacterales bacterium]